MTLSTEQLEELERLVAADPNLDRYERYCSIDVKVLRSLIAAAANRSTAGFGAEGVDQRGGVPAGCREVVGALVLELHCCAQQLAARGCKGRPGDSVSRALDGGRAMLAAAPKAPTTPDLAVKELVEAARIPGAYPIAIIEDRYGGTYSGGRWLAVAQWDRHVTDIDDGPAGGDCEAMEFWTSPPDWIAVGATPDAALRRLSRALAALGGGNQAEGVG